MKNLIVIFVVLVLGGCASEPVRPPPVSQHLFSDQLFVPPAQPINASDVFAINDEMKHFLHREIGLQLRELGLMHGLVEALNRKSQIKLEYDSEMTRTASQAFNAKSGNCLSLVVMTAALAKELGLAVQYQTVLTDETWSRSNGLYFSAGHVNLVLGKRLNRVGRVISSEENSITVDFLPPEDALFMRSFEISESTVLAMFMNNRAAETLSRGQINEAYWWAREAIRQEPGFMPAYNTLGVVYLKHNNINEAELAFATILQRDPNNTVAMANEVVALDRLGRSSEANALSATLLKLQPHPPFYYFNLGVTAMNDGDYKKARDMFAKEIDRAPYYHEFHFWLAQALLHLGDVKRAQTELNLALENSTTHKEQDLYSAKLEKLKAYGMH